MALWALAGRWRGGGASVAHPVRDARRPGGGGVEAVHLLPIL